MILELNNQPAANASLEGSLQALKEYLQRRLEAHFNGGSIDNNKYTAEQFASTQITQHINDPLTREEWMILLLVLAPHVQPAFFESAIMSLMPSGGEFAEFGGCKSGNHRAMLPTGETVQFILAGMNMEERLAVQQIFREDHFFYRQAILWLEPVKEGEPVMSGRIVIAQEWVDKILHGKESAPRFGLDFPARQITTNMLWDDVVLHPRTMNQVNDISNWLKFHGSILADENLKRKIKPGYRVLFYGSPGTGKTLTAALLGKQFGKDVYRVDLSQIVSKYIGETEKNLETVFRRAESKDWILFFDEADALFGKRTNVQSAHDKYANQEVSYLLQRVEDYPGLLILASNFRNNLDDAFIRRFHSIINFPVPNASERMTIWEKSLPASLSIDPGIDLKNISEQYELTGASILNAVHFAVLQAFSRGNRTLLHQDLVEGVKKEFLKEEKAF